MEGVPTLGSNVGRGEGYKCPQTNPSVPP
ncbi:hypothetical protein NXF25_002058 [Crotalus adamanteus]|uniref:Uncharacterized protein n=1 Tax=Crotalus adamanteus TaxID=8729 RepID=A0AAW1B0I9_CROAD